MDESLRAINRLSQEGTRIGDDPELAELHIKASRHFGAATRESYDGDRDVAIYEMEQVDRTLSQLRATVG